MKPAPRHKPPRKYIEDRQPPLLVSSLPMITGPAKAAQYWVHQCHNRLSCYRCLSSARVIQGVLYQATMHPFCRVQFITSQLLVAIVHLGFRGLPCSAALLEKPSAQQ